MAANFFMLDNLKLGKLLGKRLKNTGNFLAKIVKKLIFSKMKFALPVYYVWRIGKSYL